MSTWIDRIKTHQIWQQLQILGPVIDQALAREDVDAATIDGLNRLKAVLTFVGRRLEGADSYLLHQGPLDNLNSAIQSATSEVQSFISTGQVSHIITANSHGDNALAYLAQLNVPIVTTDLVALQETAENYRTTIERNMRSLDSTFAQTEKDLDGLRGRLTELTNEVSNEKQRLTSLSAEHQSQFSAAQESRSQEFAKAHAGLQDKFMALISDYTQQLTEQNVESGKQREASSKKYEADLSQMSQQYRISASGVLKDIESHKSQVEKLVGVIGDLGVTSGYQKTANQARWQAVVWQVIAVAALVSMTFIAYHELLPLLKSEFTWEGFATRLVLFLPIGLLAAYAISQSDRYQQVERRSRKLALELEAIGPYIASLPIEKQEEFKLKIGDRSFGTGADLIDRHSIKSPSSIVDVAKSKELRELITDIIKAVKQHPD